MSRTPQEAFPVALCAALCDVVSLQLTQFQALLGLLGKKGYLTTSEWNQAKTDIPEAEKAKLAEDLRSRLQQRIADWTQEIMNAPPPSGNVH